MTWIGWDKLCRNKGEGGLGFKDLKAFNLAMLGKQCWRLLSKDHSLFFKVFKGKYFKYKSFLQAEVGNNPSWAWRSLLEGRKVIEKGTKWQVGKGDQITIRTDPWFSNEYPFTLPSTETIEPSIQMVNQLLTSEDSWNEQLIRSKFNEEIA